MVIFGKVGIWCLHKGLWLIVYPNNIHFEYPHAKHCHNSKFYILSQKFPRAKTVWSFLGKISIWGFYKCFFFDFLPQKTFISSTHMPYIAKIENLIYKLKNSHGQKRVWSFLGKVSIRWHRKWSYSIFYPKKHIVWVPTCHTLQK